MRWWTLSILAALLLTGCTALPGGNGEQAEEGPGDTAGLELSFTQLESFALAGQTTTLQLTAENVGQSDATGVQAQLFGQFSSGTASLGTLDAADRAAGQPGGSTVHEWTVDVPADVPTGETETLTADVRVTYGYTTTATVPVTLSSKAFARSQSPVTVDSTAAPVRITSSVKSPIPTGGDTQQHTVPITVEDVGRGEVVNGQVTVDPNLQNPPSGVSLDCGGDTVTRTVAPETTIICTLNTGGGVSFETDLPLTVTASYTYARELSTPVRVRGTS